MSFIIWEPHRHLFHYDSVIIIIIVIIITNKSYEHHHNDQSCDKSAMCMRYQTWIKDWDVVNGNHNDLHSRSIQTWTMRVVTCFSIMLITFDQYLGWHGDYNLKTDIVDDKAMISSKFWCKYISDLDSGVSLNLRSGSQTGRQNSRWWWTIWWFCIWLIVSGISKVW